MTLCSSWRVLFASLLFFAAVLYSARGEDEVRLRAAITRSLDFLEKEGDVWMNEKTCNGCHHMPLLLWSEREAKRRGFKIDQARLDEFTEWSDERAKNIGAGREMTAFMKLAMPDKSVPALTKIITEGQQPDGSWKPAGQFGSMQRRDTPEATENSARLFLLALGTQPADAKLADEARAKAAALFEKAAPAKSVETLVVRTLYARRFGKPEEVTALRDQILPLQHADGGWAWSLDEKQSDPLATGEVLYLLQQQDNAAACGPAIARAREWLLTRQREDGGWSIDPMLVSKTDRSTPAKAASLKNVTGIYTYWGTAWATLGLLQGVPAD